MKNKLIKLGIAIFLFSVFMTSVSADADYTFRTTKDGKPVVEVNNQKLYVTVSLNFNMEKQYSQINVPIANITAKYDNGLYISVKRSEINKILKEKKYENVYYYLNINADFLDLQKDKTYYYFHQNNASSQNGEGYTITISKSDYMIRNYNIVEVFSGSISLTGFSMEEQYSYGGGFMLFEASEAPTNYEDYPKKYNKSEIDTSTNVPLINIDKSNIYVTLIEDEKIDLGENTNIVSPNLGINSQDGTNLPSEQQLLDINNFYAEYFDNNKLKYSWTIYDTEGNAVELNNDTLIKIDDSDNEEKIEQLFDFNIEDLKDRIKIISFNHDGDLNGIAKISLYVGDKFESGSILTLYYYNPTEQQLEQMQKTNSFDAETLNNIYKEALDSYTVMVDQDGYIAIELTHCSEYVLVDETVSKLVNEEMINRNNISETQKEEKENLLNIKFIIISFCIFTIIALSISIIILIKKKRNDINGEK